MEQARPALFRGQPPGLVAPRLHNKALADASHSAYYIMNRVRGPWGHVHVPRVLQKVAASGIRLLPCLSDEVSRAVEDAAICPPGIQPPAQVAPRSLKQKSPWAVRMAIAPDL